MSNTQDQLNAFHQFATARLASGDSSPSFDELLVEWDSVRNQDEINAAIQEGLDDIEAGRTRPVDEVVDEFRQGLGLPE